MNIALEYLHIIVNLYGLWDFPAQQLTY